MSREANMGQNCLNYETHFVNFESEESKWRTNVEIDVVFFISLESKHWTFQSFKNRTLTEE